MALHLGAVVGGVQHPPRCRVGGEDTFLRGRAAEHRLLQQVFVYHVQFPRGARFVQNQQVGGLGHGGAQVLVLQLAGGSLFGVIHPEHELLPGLAAVNFRAQLLQQRDLAAFAALQKLHDDDGFPAAQRTQGKTHGGGGLPFSVAPIKMQQPLFHQAFSSAYRTVFTTCRTRCVFQSQASST